MDPTYAAKVMAMNGSVDVRGEHELRGVPGTWRLWSAAA